jgi:MtN3 and saliva related transmembrane protein
MTPVSLIGSAAALCTTGAYIPQLVKTWRSRRAADISGHMFALLMLGTALWLAYGILKSDWAIIAAKRRLAGAGQRRHGAEAAARLKDYNLSPRLCAAVQCAP